MPVRSALERARGEGPCHQGGERRFQHYESHERRRHHPQLTGQESHVEQHADGNEEHTEENVAERADHRVDLMPVLGLREHHPRQKRAQR